jgi:predicted transcriptional regulator
MYAIPEINCTNWKTICCYFPKIYKLEKLYFETRDYLGGGQDSFDDDEREFLLLLNFSKGALSRKKILENILFDYKNCAQIAKNINLNWRTVDRNLRILYKSNYVKSIKFGRREFFKISRKGELILASFKSKKEKILEKQRPQDGATFQKSDTSFDNF